MKNYLEIGEVVTVHGLRGQIKLYPWSDSPACLAKLPEIFLAEGAKGVKVEQISVQKNMLLIKLAGCDSVESARAYIGKTLYARREDIPLAPGSHFVQDLIGLRVCDAHSGRCYGRVEEVRNNGAHDYYSVRTPGGSLCFFPAVEEFLHSLDLEKGEVLIKPIEGMFPDED